MAVKSFSAEEFQDMCDESQGFCTTCQDFTRDTCEPDACNYDCPECMKLTVFGAEQAMMMGLLEVEEGED
jgi:hypothetical protein